MKKSVPLFFISTWLLLSGCYRAPRVNPHDPLAATYAVHFQLRNEFALPESWNYQDLAADSNTVFLRTTSKPTAHILRYDFFGNKMYDVDAGYTDGRFIRYTPASGGILACNINDAQVETLQAVNASPLSTTVNLTNGTGVVCKMVDFHIESTGFLQVLSINTKELLRYNAVSSLQWGSGPIIQPESLAPFGANETAVLCETGLKRPHLRRQLWQNGALQEIVTNIGVMTNSGAEHFLYPGKMKSDGSALYFSVLFDAQGLSLYRWNGGLASPVHLSPEVTLFHGFTFSLKGDLVMMRTNGGGGGIVYVYEKKN